MRELSPEFIEIFKQGHLQELITKVIEDKDLDFQIRDKYINLYFKGNSLLKLSEANYKVEINKKFTNGLMIPEELSDAHKTQAFIENVPYIKENIIKYGSSSLEVEYEQLIIRANNLEPRNNSEYFIIDRQYTKDNQGRFDLTGFYWERNGRKRGQTVPLCLMELKFALNSDIKNLDGQLLRYYDVINNNAEEISIEAEKIFKQKLELGLFNQDTKRVEALKSLTFTRKISGFQFIIILIDYDPNSSLFNLDILKKLPFAKQIKVFNSGFAMWYQNMKSI
jgi:hypothetical protein